MKRIAILGSTGSIGTQTLEVVRENGDIEVLGLAAGKQHHSFGGADRDNSIQDWRPYGPRRKPERLCGRVLPTRIRRSYPGWMDLLKYQSLRIRRY